MRIWARFFNELEFNLQCRHGMGTNIAFIQMYIEHCTYFPNASFHHMLHTPESRVHLFYPSSATTENDLQEERTDRMIEAGLAEPGPRGVLLLNL